MKIDHIYVINLKRDVDRKIRMEEQLKKHDLQNYTFFEAIDGQNEDLSKYEFKVIPDWYNPIHKKIMTKGEIACALSHYKLWEQIIVSDFQNVLILEDDAILLDFFSKKIEEMDMTNVDIDFLFLGRQKLNVEIEEEKFNDFLLKPLYSYHTHAYVLYKSGATKLLSCNYLNNLLPIDEFLPLLYDTSSYAYIHYSNYFTDLPILKIYSIFPLLVNYDVKNYKSNTFHSDAYINMEKNNNYLVLSVATDNNDMLKRFQKSCNVYGIDYKIIGLNQKWEGGDMINGMGGGQKINLLREELSSWNNQKLKNTTILFTDGYDVIFTTNMKEITQKYKKMALNNEILFSTEKICWPDTSLSIKYPEVNYVYKYLNSGGFIGNAFDILQLIETPIQNKEDDQLYFTHQFLDNKYNNILLDYDCEIFQTLNGCEFQINITNIYNLETKTYPYILHGNGPTKYILDRISDYVCNGWNPEYLFCLTYHMNDYPKIFINSEVEINSETFNYPFEQIIIKNSNEHCIKEFLDSDAEFYFYIHKNYIIQNQNILNELLQANKDIISPMFLDDNNTPNFVSYDDVFIKNNDKYIINNEVKSIWIVNNIYGIYLIKRSIIETYYCNGIHTNSNNHFDILKNNVYLYISNLSYYGYIKKDLNEIVFKNLIQYIYQNNNSLSSYLCNDIIELFENENTVMDPNTKIHSYIITNNEKWKNIHDFLIKELQININKYTKIIDNKPNYTSKQNYNMNYSTINNLHYLSNIIIMKYSEYERDYINEYEFELNKDNNGNIIYSYIKCIWYLNDLPDNYIEFWQNTKINSEKGKLIFIPISWVYDYKEIKSTEYKYIIVTTIYIKMF